MLKIEINKEKIIHLWQEGKRGKERERDKRDISKINRKTECNVDLFKDTNICTIQNNYVLSCIKAKILN